MIVYIATNKINNKKYIGYTTKTLEERKKIHFDKSKRGNNKHYFYLFPQAIRKYGFDNFVWEILFESDSKEELQQMEIHYIKEYNTISPNGYNLTEGGNGGVQSDETKLKISNTLKEFYQNNPHPATSFSTEQRSEMGKKAWITKIENGFKYPTGFTRSVESRNKMSETKNDLNRHTWFNIKSNETIILSLTKMADYTGLSRGVFNHLKHGRQKQTKCGWTFIN